MNEQEWWASAPEWAEWHTWDRMGKCWWRIRPVYENDSNGWVTPQGEREQTVLIRDVVPLPVELEIDPSKTLRKRPKAEGEAMQRRFLARLNTLLAQIGEEEK